ncbi:response regulator transcription factor [Frigoribacterium sp. ACAM 257]|uniref:response regulator n=1 Tax=Frigoribacterium sp. ACAM 257 TaxID=2508998 RepID=UPI0011B95BB4|nr:response regulator transcription factor [Frigoribacterium sp. ACAM 257]TWX35620.1 response regulator transcription factor [Frigoribacterium sp. ACAM 257]
MNDTTVLIADDQPMVRLGTTVVVGRAPGLRVVGEAATGRTAVEAATALRPDVVLMDIRMPDVDGVEATRRIVETLPEVRVLALTTFDLDEYAFGVLHAGASGFLAKDCTAEELVSAIRTVAAGEAVTSPRVTSALIALHRHRFAELVPTGDAAASLTTREREILRRVGHGLSNAEIAHELYLAESTVKTHLSHVLAKLGVRDRVQAAIWVHHHGAV